MSAGGGSGGFRRGRRCDRDRFRRGGDDGNGLRGDRGRFRLGGYRLEMALEVLGGDLIERAGWNSRAGNAQFFRLGKDLLAFDSQLLRNFVDTNGHNKFLRTDWTTTFS